MVCQQVRKVRSTSQSVLNIQLVELRTQEALGQQHNAPLLILQTGQSHIPFGCVLGALIDQQVGSTPLTQGSRGHGVEGGVNDTHRFLFSGLIHLLA